MSDKTLKERTLKRLEGMTPDERALFVSKHLMQVEWALELVCDDIDALRKDDTGAIAQASMAVLGALHGIRSHHMTLTQADAVVYGRDIPNTRSR